MGEPAASLLCGFAMAFDPQAKSFASNFKTYSSSLTSGICCVGCDIVQADHASEAGVAQGIFHGILVRHHGRNLEEVEEGLEDEVERHKEEDTQKQVRMSMTMDGNDADANET